MQSVTDPDLTTLTKKSDRVPIGAKKSELVEFEPGSAVEPASGQIDGRRKGSMLARSFFVLVVIPTFSSLLYFGLIATDVYTSEAKLVVRAATDQKSASGPGEMLAKFGLSSSSSPSIEQDVFILLNYIKSRTLIDDVGGQKILEKYFSGNHIDWLSRLPTEASSERLIRYWRSHVRASVDNSSGVLTMSVEAYSADDAAKLAQGIIDHCEALLNNLSHRMRADALAEAEDEIKRSAELLSDARNALVSFRNKTGVVDPIAKAGEIGTLIAKLTEQQVESQSELNAISNLTNKNSLSVSQLHLKIDSLEKQIVQQKHKLTDATGQDTLADQISSYERLLINEEFRSKIYEISFSALERARQNTERQQRYVATIERPTLPTSAEYPKPLLFAILTFVSASVIWGVFSLIGAAVKDHVQGSA